MHQAHNLPWDHITSNFKFKANDRGFTPPFSGLVSKNNPNAHQQLNHFVRKFAHVIRTFSDTERAKYPEAKLIKPRFEGNLFSDELKEKYPEYLNDQNQRIEFWIRVAKPRYWFPSQGENDTATMEYGTGEGDLADVLKVLLYENEMSTLIMLAHHPKIPILSLRNLSWGHHFGFSRVMESALRAYLFFNAAEATGTLANGEYTQMHEYGSLLTEIGMSMDFPAQQIPHRKFLESCGVSEGGYIITKGADRNCRDWARDINVHTDLARLKEYVKTLFALLYRYDLLVRECGIEAKWEEEMVYYYPINRGLR